MEHTFQPWLNCLKKNMRLINLIIQPHNANTQLFKSNIEGIIVFSLEYLKLT